MLGQGVDRREATPASLHRRSPEPIQRRRPEYGDSDPTRAGASSTPPLTRCHWMPIVAGDYYFDALMASGMKLHNPTCHGLQAVEIDGHPQHSAASA